MGCGESVGETWAEVAMGSGELAARERNERSRSSSAASSLAKAEDVAVALGVR